MTESKKIQELQILLKSKDERIRSLENKLAERDEKIEQLKSQLDKFQSVFPKAIPRRVRAQGISAEPQTAKSIQDYMTNNVLQKHRKSSRYVQFYCFVFVYRVYFSSLCLVWGNNCRKKGKAHKNNSCRKARVIFAGLSLLRQIFPHFYH